MERDELQVHQKMFMVTFEERDQVLRPLAEEWPGSGGLHGG